MGLAHNVRLKRPIKKDQIVSYDDVDLVDDLDVPTKSSCCPVRLPKLPRPTR